VIEFIEMEESLRSSMRCHAKRELLCDTSNASY
jgi:hypothetical protein